MVTNLLFALESLMGKSLKQPLFLKSAANTRTQNMYTEIRSYNTYIIGHYNPSFRIIDLASHTAHVLCVHFIREWRDFRTTDFVEKLFITILFTLRVFARNLLSGNRRRNTFRILF